MRYRDSLCLYAYSINLGELAQTICPHLGSKGALDHEALNAYNLNSKKESVLYHRRQDIFLLGGVIARAQSLYGVILSWTPSSMSLLIFRIWMILLFRPSLFFTLKPSFLFIHLAQLTGGKFLLTDSWCGKLSLVAALTASLHSLLIQVIRLEWASCNSLLI